MCQVGALMTHLVTQYFFQPTSYTNLQAQLVKFAINTVYVTIIINYYIEFFVQVCSIMKRNKSVSSMGRPIYLRNKPGPT